MLKQNFTIIKLEIKWLLIRLKDFVLTGNNDKISIEVK